MNYDQGKHLMLPLARERALSIRAVSRLQFSEPCMQTPSREGSLVPWLWLDTTPSPSLTRLWLLHSEMGGGISQTWWLPDLAPQAPLMPSLYLLCRIQLAIAEEAFFVRFPLPDLEEVLVFMRDAPCTGLSVSHPPPLLTKWENQQSPLFLDIQDLTALVARSIVLSELSKSDLQRYLQMWRTIQHA